MSLPLATLFRSKFQNSSKKYEVPTKTEEPKEVNNTEPMQTKKIEPKAKEFEWILTGHRVVTDIPEGKTIRLTRDGVVESTGLDDPRKNRDHLNTDKPASSK